MTTLHAMTADRQPIGIFDHDDPEAHAILSEWREEQPDLIVAYRHERLVVGMVDVTDAYFAGGLTEFPGAAP